MVHLDTNFLINALKPATPQDAQLRTWFQKGEAVGVSSVVWAEFLCGPLTLEQMTLAKVMFPHIEPLLAADSEKGAELFNATGRRSRSLADCLIAAVALRCGARLVTTNLDDFEPFTSHGLTLV